MTPEEHDTLSAQDQQQRDEQRRRDDELAAGRYVSVLDELTGKRVRVWPEGYAPVIGRLVQTQGSVILIHQEDTGRPFVFSGTYTLEILEG